MKTSSLFKTVVSFIITAIIAEIVAYFLGSVLLGIPIEYVLLLMGLILMALLTGAMVAYFRLKKE